jgi:acetyl-CoA carboxylase biotin carboxyl carrier protein
VPDDRPATPDEGASDEGARDGAARDGAAREGAGRAADQAGLERLVDTLVPALMAKLGTLNVGELDVREGDWRIRLRRPAGAAAVYGRRATDRPSRSQPGHEQHGHSPGAPEPHRGTRPAAEAGSSTNGSTGPALAPVGPGRPAGGAPVSEPGPGAVPARIATSPAVGVFQPGPTAVGGTRVRAGDRLGVVDMLGVPQEVVAPVDGIVIGVIVDAGTAVEYGQELVQLEAAPAVEAR